MKINEIIERFEKEQKLTKAKLVDVKGLQRLKDVAKLYDGEDRVVSFSDIAQRLKTAPDELKMLSGWSSLDSLLQGFRLQQVVVVSALTKSGKTSWLMDLTDRLRAYKPVWFPFEESAEELIRKFLERDEEPPQGFTPEVISNSSISWIESKVVEAIAKYDSKVVVIDQLDFIVQMSGDNHSLRVGQAMRDLKAVAKKWNVCIFLICHLVKAKMDTQPTLEDLKGSSSIGQEADTVIMLWREMKKERGQVIITDNVNVSVQANRRTGKTGNVKMKFIKGKFIEEDWVSRAEERDKEFQTY